ncbi:MAG: hypothetical protein ABWZ83_09400 [Mesorhizobium sp.]
MSVVKTLGIALAVLGLSAIRTANGFWDTNWARDVAWVENPTGRQIADYLLDRTSKILLSKAELRETKIVEQPKDWLDRAEAERQYRAEWSERENLPFHDLFVAIARF